MPPIENLPDTMRKLLALPGSESRVHELVKDTFCKNK